MRSSGILLPVFSLPSRHGIGTFSQEAFDFIDQLHKSGQRYWQILPLAPAGGWNSPYQPLSCFAGDPVYISPVELCKKGLITESELSEDAKAFFLADSSKVDYALVKATRKVLFDKAYERFVPDEDYERFCKENESWLDDFAVFTAIRDYYGGESWSTWPKKIRMRDEEALSELTAKLEHLIGLVKWTQYEFLTQWRVVVEYAHSRNIDIIGDIPIYASYDSSDCWAHPELFKLTKALKQTAIAGCPPDAFSPDGQLWGNPLYNWRYHKETGYRWWIDRIRQNFKLYDVIRIDHIRGFSAYFSIPAKDETAANGKWIKGPGIGFFKAVNAELGNCRFIAEDLGVITDDVNKMLKKAGFPGMKVLQFAFDSDDKNPYLPDNFGTNCIVYTGTHDNNTTTGWYNSGSGEMKRKITSYIRKYKGWRDTSIKAPMFSGTATDRLLVELAFQSKADTCIIQMQDHLMLGAEGRVNTPGTVGGNWEWRMDKGAFTDALAEYILRLTKQYGRYN